MIKRKFGMKCLNISQSRYGNFSHKGFNAYDLVGIDTGRDFFYATNELEIIGVHRFNYATKKGFANTVHFYDKENDVTIAMTHKDKLSIDYYVGKKFKPGTIIYAEGTAGKATGNHIHIEIAKGRQPNKVKTGVGYVLFNWINIEDYFYIDPEFTTSIKNTKGINFEVRKDDELMDYELINPNLTLHILGINKSFETYDKPAGSAIGRINSDEYLKVYKITKNLINGYKYCLVDTYTQEQVYVKVDLDYMRFEI